MEVLNEIFRGQSWISYLQILTALIGLSQIGKFKNSSLRLFILCFLYFALNDFFALFYGRTIGGGYNSIIYNIYHVVFFAIVFNVFHSHIKNIKFKIIIILMYVIYLLLILVELLLLNYDYFQVLQVWPYISGGIFIFLCLVYYFYEALNSEYVVQLDRQLIFWIGIAYFFWFLAVIPFRISREVSIANQDFDYMFTLNRIMTVALCISLITGFLWSRRET